MNDLIKIIQHKKIEQRELFNKFESVGNEAMKNIAAAKINILDEVIELANEVSAGSAQSNIPDIIKSLPEYNEILYHAKTLTDEQFREYWNEVQGNVL